MAFGRFHVNTQRPVSLEAKLEVAPGAPQLRVGNVRHPSEEVRTAVAKALDVPRENVELGMTERNPWQDFGDLNLFVSATNGKPLIDGILRHGFFPEGRITGVSTFDQTTLSPTEVKRFAEALGLEHMQYYPQR